MIDEAAEMKGSVMALPHAEPGQLIDVQPLGDAISETRTHTLFKTPSMEVIRMVLREGQQISPHQAPGDLIVHCLEGKIAFTFAGKTQELSAGQMLYLSNHEEHAVECIAEASFLLTIIFDS